MSDLLMATIIIGSVIGYLSFGYGLGWILYKTGGKLDDRSDTHFMVCTTAWPVLALLLIALVAVTPIMGINYMHRKLMRKYGNDE